MLSPLRIARHMQYMKTFSNPFSSQSCGSEFYNRTWQEKAAAGDAGLYREIPQREDVTSVQSGSTRSSSKLEFSAHIPRIHIHCGVGGGRLADLGSVATSVSGRTEIRDAASGILYAPGCARVESGRSDPQCSRLRAVALISSAFAS